MDRDERHRRDVLAALDRGDDGRVVALALEHLAEYPDDAVVRQALEHARARVGDRRRATRPG